MTVVRVTATHRVEGESLGGWAAAIQEPASALEAVGEAFSNDLDERLATRTTPWGDAWAPPSAVTLEIRSRRGTRNGSLRRSKVRRLATNRVSVGLSAPFARAFQYGAPGNKAFGRGSAPIPARAFLPLRGRRHALTDAMRVEVRRAFRGGLLEAVRRHRGG